MTVVYLAAREDVYGVCVGGILGHALCTGLAVVGGRLIATRISVRTVTLVNRSDYKKIILFIIVLKVCDRAIGQN